SFQDAIAQQYRIAGAALRKFDHLHRNDIRLIAIGVTQSERLAHVSIDACHTDNRLGPKGLVPKEVINRHPPRLPSALLKCNTQSASIKLVVECDGFQSRFWLLPRQSPHCPPLAANASRTGVKIFVLDLFRTPA